jgi:hypothetical protein
MEALLKVLCTGTCIIFIASGIILFIELRKAKPGYYGKLTAEDVYKAMKTRNGIEP